MYIYVCVSMYVCYAQSMDLHNPLIALHKVANDTLHNKVWICYAFHGLFAWYFAQSMYLVDEILFCFEVMAYTLRSCVTSHS